MRNTSSPVSQAAEMALTVARAVYRTGTVILATLLGIGLLFIYLTHAVGCTEKLAMMIIGAHGGLVVIAIAGAVLTAKRGPQLPRIFK